MTAKDALVAQAPQPELTPLVSPRTVPALSEQLQRLDAAAQDAHNLAHPLLVAAEDLEARARAARAQAQPHVETRDAAAQDAADLRRILAMVQAPAATPSEDVLPLANATTQAMAALTAAGRKA